MIQLFVNLMNKSKRITIRNNQFVLYVQKYNKFNKLNKYRIEKSQKNVFFAKKAIIKRKNVDLNIRNYVLNSKRIKLLLLQKKIAMFVINTSININEKLNFDVTEYNNLIYLISNANCEFAYIYKK